MPDQPILAKCPECTSAWYVSPDKKKGRCPYCFEYVKYIFMTKQPNKSTESVVEIKEPRVFGKTSKALSMFWAEGKLGKAVVFATPQGNFLSPKAVENVIQQSKEEERERMNKQIKRKMSFHQDDTMVYLDFKDLLNTPSK